MSFGEEGIDDPSDFQANAFQDLDEHFRCPICKEFFETTMILSTCSHSFCALCIRRSLNTEQNCPQCRKTAYESDLIHNYALDHVVNTWRNNRSFILNADRNASIPQPQPQPYLPAPSMQPNHYVSNHYNGPPPQPHYNANNHYNTIPPQPQHIAHNHYIAPPPPPPLQQQPISYNSSKSLPIVFDTDTSDDFKPKQVSRSNSAQPAVTRRSNRLSSQTAKQDKGKGVETAPYIDLSSPPHIPAIPPPPPQQQIAQTDYQNTLGQSVEQTADEPLKSSSMVECPMCTQSMALIVLNQHIDGCMKGDSRIPPSPAVVGSSKSTVSALSNLMPQKAKAIDLGRKPSKVVYALMKDKDLKQALRDLGLSDQGDKATRIWRHKEYINLYNANYDSDNPVSANVLVQRLNSIEQLKISDKYNQLKRKATDIDEHKQLYKSQFDELTENARRNRMAKKSKESSSQEMNTSAPGS